MTPPRRAMILAAGLGTRMQPLTHGTPKCLLPLWNRPVLEHNLAMLSSWGVQDFLINVHRGAEAIVRFVQTLQGKYGRIHLSFEPELLGTGGALKRAEWFLDHPRAPFWLCNADIVASLSPMPLMRRFTHRAPLAALWLVEHQGPQTVTMTADGRIQTFRAANAGNPGTYTFSGLHLLSPQILPFLHEKFSSIVSAYETAARQQHDILGVVVKKSAWADIGTPEQYLQAHFSRRGGAYTPALPAQCDAAAQCCTAPGVVVSPRAKVRNSVILSGCRIGPRAIIRNAVLGPGCSINAPVTHVAVRFEDSAPGPQERHILHRLGWKAATTVLAPLPPGGSDRSYTRWISGSRSVIVQTYTDKRPENRRFAAVSAFLRQQQIPVPEILHHDRRRRVVVQEDAGVTSLLDVREDTGLRQRGYRQAVHAMVRLHRMAPDLPQTRRLQLEPSFASGVYAWEHDWFLQHYVQRYCRPSRQQAQTLRRELAGIAAHLAAQPEVLLHRDFQSTNIMLHRKGVYLIDVQGLRRGPAVYDLASLLYDPYAELLQNEQTALLDLYCRESGGGANIQTALDAAVIQRLCQALGAYAHLVHDRGLTRFAAFIPPARHFLLAALSRTGKQPILQQLIAG